jgi:flagellin-like protein
MVSSFWKKRGVSPLIATVLLISFAVALGSVVLNWGRNLEISKPGDLCTGVELKIREIGDAQICYFGSGTESHIKFILDNVGKKDIDGIGIWITGEKGTSLLDYNEFLIKKGELLDVKDSIVKYDFKQYGQIRHVQFFPKVKNGNSVEICARSVVKAEKSRYC